MYSPTSVNYRNDSIHRLPDELLRNVMSYAGHSATRLGSTSRRMQGLLVPNAFQDRGVAGFLIPDKFESFDVFSEYPRDDFKVQAVKILLKIFTFRPTRSLLALQKSLNQMMGEILMSFNKTDISNSQIVQIISTLQPNSPQYYSTNDPRMVEVIVTIVDSLSNKQVGDLLIAFAEFFKDQMESLAPNVFRRNDLNEWMSAVLSAVTRRVNGHSPTTDDLYLLRMISQRNQYPDEPFNTDVRRSDFAISARKSSRRSAKRTAKKSAKRSPKRKASKTVKRR